jgi:hypothetical protein
MTELVGRALQFHQPQPRRGTVTRRNNTLGAMKPTETARHARELRGPNVTRQRPPNRSGHELLGFEHDGIRYTAGIGRFVDGGVAKIIRNIAKHGTALDVNARAAAVAAPPLVQFSCPVDTLREAVNRNSDGSGSGLLACTLDLLVE